MLRRESRGRGALFASATRNFQGSRPRKTSSCWMVRENVSRNSPRRVRPKIMVAMAGRTPSALHEHYQSQLIAEAAAFVTTRSTGP
jgi:hypothetical protein